MATAGNYMNIQLRAIVPLFREEKMETLRASGIGTWNVPNWNCNCFSRLCGHGIASRPDHGEYGNLVLQQMAPILTNHAGRIQLTSAGRRGCRDPT